MPPEPAAGTQTVLFTDIEGSTRLWDRLPHAMKAALERHDAILRSAVESSNGTVVKTTGDGLMAVFASASAGVTACLTAQRALADEEWGDTGALRVRMGLNSGEVDVRARDYFGPTVNRAARIMAVGHGGQVLLSASAAALVIDQLPDGATLRNLGEHRLKDLGRPENVFQLVHPALHQDFPPLTTLEHRPNNLPTESSTFVGREAEIEQIRERLENDAVRLLTLTGPGGTGKTRLALRGAAQQIYRFDGGVFFVDLSTVRDTNSVLAAIARTIGVSETSGQTLVEDLVRRLRHQRVLLILDNFEQVTAAAPTMVGLLSDCPGLTLLVTSREPLHVRGEQLLPVPPLSVPAVVFGHDRSTGELAQYEAIQLFVDRAKEARPDFQLTDANASAVAEVCLRLDGLPLAIELATARIRLLPPQALCERLSSRLQLLRSGARDLPVRQQTLRATIDWSYQLLQPEEQRLLEVLSAFSSGSGSGFEAIDFVASKAALLHEEAADALDGLTSLLDKSLVRHADTEDGEPRVVMLETIREYAAERLEERPEFSAAVRRNHAVYFAQFAQEQWQHLTGQRREPALAAMAADIDNLRLAWRYWVAERDLDQLNKLVDSLWLLYDAKGWYHDTVDLTNDLLNVLSSSPSTPERATREVMLRTSLARALMAIKGYTAQVEEMHTRALQLMEGQELPQLFPVLRSLASFYNFRAEFDKGTQVGQQILRLAEQQNDAAMLVDGHLVLGSNLAFLNDLHAGLEHLDKAIGYFQSEPYRSGPFRLGNNPGVACFTTSAFILWLLGWPDRALQRANDGVALATELEHPFTLAYAQFHAGFLHLWRREADLVRERALGVLQVVADHDFQIWRALGTCLLGAAEAEMGQSEKGLARIRQGIDLYQGLKTPPVFWPLILFIHAGAHARAGRAADGLVLIDHALDVAGRGSGMRLLPQLHLRRGDLLLLLSKENRPNAEASFQHAFDVARGLDARMPQLQAAVRLCRLRRDEGAPDQECRDLATVYDTFSEGFHTADLVEAAALLS